MFASTMTAVTTLVAVACLTGSAAAAPKRCPGHIVWHKSIHATEGHHRLLGVLIVTQDHRHHTTCGIIKRRGTVKAKELGMTITITRCFTSDPKDKCGSTATGTKQSGTINDYYEHQSDAMIYITDGKCVQVGGSMGTLDGRIYGSAFTARDPQRGNFCHG